MGEWVDVYPPIMHDGFGDKWTLQDCVEYQPGVCTFCSEAGGPAYRRKSGDFEGQVSLS